MAEIIKIRSSVFIPDVLWMAPGIDSSTGTQFEFGEVTREFFTNKVNTMCSRVEQEVVVDFLKKEVFSYSKTGITNAKITYPNGKVEVMSGRASSEGIYCGNINWLSEEAVQFTIHASTRNPLRPNAPTVDYQFSITCSISGKVQISGQHDGLPSYKIYKQVDFGDLEIIYTHDYKLTGDSSEVLDGSIEYKFEKVI